jgi:hypothetical protein
MGMRLLTAMSNQYFGADRCLREMDPSNEKSFALSPVSAGFALLGAYT